MRRRCSVSHLRFALLMAIVCIGCTQDFPKFTPYTGWQQADSSVPSISEIACNNLDDDRDGLVDEFIPSECSGGLGLCAGTGVFACRFESDGTSVVYCDYEGAQAALEEACDNGLDDDCDGRADERCGCVEGSSQPCYTGDRSTIGQGECREGSQICLNGSFGDCGGELVTRQDESCNGLDDDCDARTDEGMFSCRTECGMGLGRCEVSEMGRARIIDCSAPQPTTEVCDNLDNDCDGRIDEDLRLDDTQCPSVGNCLAEQVCVGGRLMCQTPPNSMCNCEQLSIGEGQYHLCRDEMLQKRLPEVDAKPKAMVI